MARGLIAICLITLLACSSVEGRVVANVTVGGFNFQLNLSNPKLVEELKIKRSDFPSDFLFGAATSAAQEDIKLIKDAGLNSYRFSISWSRILPKGSLSGGINQEGIDYYNSLIDELIKNGITPFVTIYHFDMPLALEEKYGGLLNRSFVNDFRDYSELLFKKFGDRVKHWFTINEPNILAQFGYELGISPPGRCSLPSTLCALGSPVKCFETVGPCKFGGNSSTEPYTAAHNIILAHATVVKLYKEKYQEQQKGELGIVLASQYFLPYTQSEEDKAAAGRLFDFYLGWFMGPLVFGDYPQSMKERVKDRLPTFSAEEKVLLNGSLGLVGINYYTSTYAKHKAPPPGEALRYSFDQWAETIAIKDEEILGTNSHWPEGLQKLLEYVKDKYQNPKLYISENGLSDHKDNGSPLEVLLEDPYRISFVTRHLYRINKAIKNGVNVKGYFYWALFDDIEWGMGFNRVGIYFVDFSNYTRYPKLSVKWFRAFLQDKFIKLKGV
ncbi:beta-glucosidase 13-like [Pyrus ussuriensis x Pyrus communis]|uniref:Beta-glucosidase 13-like n=1 Tax=Pyrus ussuriensis x Pyrus communis TaxID=2448454 RepID=A0A5N5I3V0_9ROSA|nr:beta-glucosidase 13-like [Pyrus ussuriensis x Pyrus communis]